MSVKLEKQYRYSVEHRKTIIKEKTVSNHVKHFIDKIHIVDKKLEILHVDKKGHKLISVLRDFSKE